MGDFKNTMYLAETLLVDRLDEAISFPKIPTVVAKLKKLSGKDFSFATEEEAADALIKVALAKTQFKIDPNYKSDPVEYMKVANRAKVKLDNISVIKNFQPFNDIEAILKSKNVTPASPQKKEEEPSIDSVNVSNPDTKIKAEEPKDFPKYEEFRKKWYRKTIQMGWPANPGYPKMASHTEDGVTYPWARDWKTAFIFKRDFNGDFWKKITKKIKDELYNKFEDNVKGLKALHSQVEGIVAAEDAYLKKLKEVSMVKGAFSLLGSLAAAAYRGIGATENDIQMFNWFKNKAAGMTFFQYQSMVIEQVLMLLEVDDDTALRMKNKLDAYRNMFELSFQKNNNTFKLSPTKTIYNNAYSATFDVVSTTPKRDITLFAAHVASIEIMQKAAQGSSSLDTAPNPEKVNAALKKLKKFKHDTNQNDVVEAITDMGLRVLKYEEFAYKKDEKVKEEQNAIGKFVYTLTYEPYKCKVLLSYVPGESTGEE